MTANSKAKLKMLYIRRMLEEETDAEHGLTMRQIIERLSDLGIEAERKSVYRDLELLREFGLDIRTYQRNPVEYALERRDFKLPELMLMVDAVESSRFLTRRQANMLVGNIKSLASANEQALLDRRINVAGRIRSKNEGVFETIDVIHQALRERKKLSFLYFRLGVNGKRYLTHDGKPYVLTPIGITYAEGFYYLTAWNDNHRSFNEYRVDRMFQVKVTDERRTRIEQVAPSEFDDSEYECFGRMRGEKATVTLMVKPEKAEIIWDRFGSAAEMSPCGKEWARAVVRVHVSEQFFGWVAGLGGTVKIVAPPAVANQYKDYLSSLIEGMNS